MSEEAQVSPAEALRWHKFKCGSDGFICLVDWMGDDSSITDAARISYGKGTKKLSDDANLIKYLYRHGHLTPFEMVDIKLLVRMPITIMRQWVRHRASSLNEYSMRYSEAIDSCEKVDPGAWRTQSTTNKQGSAGIVTEWPEGYTVGREGRYDPHLQREVDFPIRRDAVHQRICSAHLTPGEYLTEREDILQKTTREVYEERLKFGVSREMARKDLPLSNYTEIYWKSNLRNIFNFLSLRMDSHAQLEIREFANAMYEIVKTICPLAVAAFDEYDFRRGGLLLSATEARLLKNIYRSISCFDDYPDQLEDFNDAVKEETDWTEKSRERTEAYEKFKRLGLVG